MDFSVYLPLLLGVALASVAPRITRSLPPRTGVWVLTIAAVTAALSWVAALAMIGFTGLGRMAFIAEEGHWSAKDWRQHDPVDVWTAVLAGAILLACLALFVRAAIREGSVRRHVHRLSRGFGTQDMLVFVDDDAPHAYAVGGRRPRIVVSRGLMRTLNAAERRAVLSHEAAHVRNHHHLHLLAIRLSAAVNPLVRRSLPVAVLAIERWADEETAVTVGDRTLVARALLRAALAGAEHGRLPQGVLAHTVSDVGTRVEALMKEPPRLRSSVVVATLALLAATMVAPAIAADNLDNLFDAASPHTISTEAR